MLHFRALTGEGKGATQEDAVWSAIGEGIERYSASIWDPDQLLYAPFDDISSWAFDPRCLVLYDDEQYNDPTFPFHTIRTLSTDPLVGRKMAR